MPESQRDVRNRIASVANIQKITRAMEMVAAARLRRAEQRIAALRPYANAIGRMTREIVQAAGGACSRYRCCASTSPKDAWRCCSSAATAGSQGPSTRRCCARASAPPPSTKRTAARSSGTRAAAAALLADLPRPRTAGAYIGFTDRPSYADARQIADDLTSAYLDDQIDRVEIVYNGFVSPLVQEVRREVLLPLAAAAVLGGEDFDEQPERQAAAARALVEYEPEPEQLLGRLVPDFVEISIFRALLESTASEHGARMTAMRNASENAGELITDLTLEMNRARQAEITQEILEVVAGAEGVG